jgi:hypothetical protein
VTREIIVAGALGAALLTAALVRPPRAAPAFSPVPTGVPTSVRCPSCRPARAAASPQPKGARHARHRRASHRHGNKRPARHRSKPALVVDVNHADARELARVPGITPDLARRIVAYRAVVGPFATLDDLSDLDGLSEGRLISLGRYLVVR